MHIYVDADACPVIGIVERIAKSHNIAVTLLCDTNHYLTSDYSEVVYVGAGADAGDFKLISLCEKGDLHMPFISPGNGIQMEILILC